MINFRDLTEFSDNNTELPLEAVSFGGICLDKEIDGFITLDISGRDEFQQSFTAPTKVGDGDYYLDSRIEAKSIVVNFWLRSSDVKDYNVKLSKLKSILSQKQQRLSFADESNWHYIATVSSLNIDDDSLNPTGKITFRCCDPYKYQNVKSISGSGNSLTINDEDLSYKQIPLSMVFRPDSTQGCFEMTTSEGKCFRTITAINTNDEIEIDFEKLTYIVNKQDQLMNIDLKSNFGDFYIQNGTTITFNSSGSYEMKYEVKQL